MSDTEKSAEKSGGETITLRIHGAISEVAPQAWDACAGDVNPTVSHVFLNELEESGSATARAGWAPQHLSFADGATLNADWSYRTSNAPAPVVQASSQTHAGVDGNGYAAIVAAARRALALFADDVASRLSDCQ